MDLLGHKGLHSHARVATLYPTVAVQSAQDIGHDIDGFGATDLRRRAFATTNPIATHMQCSLDLNHVGAYSGAGVAIVLDKTMFALLEWSETRVGIVIAKIRNGVAFRNTITFANDQIAAITSRKSLSAIVYELVVLRLGVAVGVASKFEDR